MKKKLIALVLALSLAALPALAFWGEEERVYITGEAWEYKWDEVIALKCEPVKYLAQRGYRSWSLLDESGNVLIDSWFEYFRGFSEGMGVFMQKEKYGAINERGEIVVPAQYVSIGDYSDGLAPVIFEVNNAGSFGNHGYIDMEGKCVLGRYYTAEAFINGYAVVGTQGSRFEGSGGYYLPAFGLIDREGNVVIEMIYDSLTLNADGTVRATLDGVEYFFSLNIDTENPEANRWQELIELECDPVQYLGKKGDNWSLMDANYNVILPDWLTGFDGFDEYGLATVRIHGKWGLLKNDGKLLVEPNYDYIGNFCEGLARVEYSNDRGYINTSGEFACSIEFYRANDFVGGYATVATRSAPFESDYMSGGNDYMPVWGVINKNCELIVNFSYDSITIDPETGVATCEKDGEVSEIILAERKPILRAEWNEYI